MRRAREAIVEHKRVKILNLDIENALGHRGPAACCGFLVVGLTAVFTHVYMPMRLCQQFGSGFVTAHLFLVLVTFIQPQPSGPTFHRLGSDIPLPII